MDVIIAIKGSKPIQLTLTGKNIGFQFIHNSENKSLAYDSNSSTGLKIKAPITTENKAVILELLKWSLMTSGKDIYRQVNIKLKAASNDITREYDFPEMFVVDYREDFDSSDDGTFELLINQKGDTSKVKVY